MDAVKSEREKASREITRVKVKAHVLLSIARRKAEKIIALYVLALNFRKDNQICALETQNALLKKRLKKAKYEVICLHKEVLFWKSANQHLKSKLLTLDDIKEAKKAIFEARDAAVEAGVQAKKTVKLAKQALHHTEHMTRTITKKVVEHFNKKLFG